MDKKKRLYYDVDYDIDFIAINVLMVLSSYNCHTKNKKFSYPEKLGYLIQIINNEKSFILVEEILKRNYSPSMLDHKLLRETYIKGKMTKSIVFEAIWLLQAKDFIQVIETEKCFSLKLVRKIDLSEFEYYDQLRIRIESLQESYKRLASVMFTTFEDKIFGGVQSYE